MSGSITDSKKVSSLEVVDNFLVRSDVAYFSGTINANNIVTNNISVVNGVETTELQLKEPSPGTNTITVQSPALPTGSYTLTLPVDDGVNTQILITDGSGNLSWSTPSGTGDVIGPASSTNNAISVFNGTSGKVIRNSGVIIDSSNNITTSGSVQTNTSLIIQDPGVGSNTITFQAPTLNSGSYTLTMPTDNGSNTQVLTTDGSGILSWTTPNVGDLSGPASSTNDAIARFDGTTGKLVQNSGVLIDVNDNLIVPNTVTVNGSIKSNTSLIVEDPGVGSNTVSIQAPTLGTGSYVLTFPTDTGSNTEALITDGSGNLSWGPALTLPAGSNTEVQFNDNGSLGASSRLTFDKGSNTTTIFSNTQIAVPSINVIQQATYTQAWTTSSIVPAPGGLITWSPSQQKFVTVTIGSSNSAGTSTDFGSTWTSSGMAGNISPRSLIWVEDLGLFITVGINNTGRVQTSPDGITWTSHGDIDSQQWLEVVWSPKLQILCVVGVGTTNGIATSLDGINWVTRTHPVLTNGPYSIAWSEDLEIFTAIAFDEQKVLTSSDGENWTSTTIGPFPSQSWYDVIWASSLGIFCACGIGTADIITSPDGINWSSFSSPITTQTFARRIAWSPQVELFCTAGYDIATGGVISISSDGENWTTIPYPNSAFGGNPVDSVVWVPELQDFYATGPAANGFIVKSNSDFSGLDFPVDIGTAGVTTVSIDGQNIGIGLTTPNVTIGYQNTQVNIEGFIQEPTIYGNTIISNGNLSVNNGDINVPNMSTGTGNSLAIDTNGQIVDTVSLRAYKKDEVAIADEPGYDLGDVLKLQPKFFTWKESGLRDLGFVVEDALEANKAFVYRDEVLGVPKNIRDRSVLAGLVAIAQKHNIELESLEDELNKLKRFVGYSEV